MARSDTEAQAMSERRLAVVHGPIMSHTPHPISHTP
jgi:hypothetical protein